MKKIGMMLLLVLTAAMGLWAEEKRFDLFGGEAYGAGMSFTLTKDGGLLVSGKIEGKTDEKSKTAGYAIEAKGNPLEFSRAKKLIVKVSGLSGKDRFDMGKLCKLELDKAVQKTVTPNMVNRNDGEFLNARNGEAVFDLSKLRDIRKFDLIFYQCELENLTIDVFYE